MEIILEVSQRKFEMSWTNEQVLTAKAPARSTDSAILHMGGRSAEATVAKYFDVDHCFQLNTGLTITGTLVKDIFKT